MYMLDTNTVSAIFRKNPATLMRLQSMSTGNMCISVVTAGEILYGIKKRNNKALSDFAQYFFQVFPVLPWDFSVAERYGTLRSELEKEGKILGAMDLMIAAHALQAGCVLVSGDKAFRMVDQLILENWI